MKAKQLDARCPVCKEWYRIPADEVGELGRCENCGQTVRLVPRSGASRARRRFFAAMIIIGGFVLFWIIYQWRVAKLSGAFTW